MGGKYDMQEKNEKYKYIEKFDRKISREA